MGCKFYLKNRKTKLILGGACSILAMTPSSCSTTPPSNVYIQRIKIPNIDNASLNIIPRSWIKILIICQQQSNGDKTLIRSIHWLFPVARLWIIGNSSDHDVWKRREIKVKLIKKMLVVEYHQVNTFNSLDLYLEQIQLIQNIRSTEVEHK